MTRAEWLAILRRDADIEEDRNEPGLVYGDRLALIYAVRNLSAHIEHLLGSMGSLCPRCLEAEKSIDTFADTSTAGQP